MNLRATKYLTIINLLSTYYQPVKANINESKTIKNDFF